MKVTILTPTLNASRYFADCLKSLEAQTFARSGIQHLVLDGASTDGTIAMAAAAGAEVLVHEDSSLYQALNRGVRHARGDLIGWLNADDEYRHDAIARAVATFQRHPEADAVLGDYELSSPTRARIVRTSARCLDAVRSGSERGSWVIPLAIFWRASSLRSLGDFREDLRISADLDFWYRAAARVPALRLYHTDSTIGTFRIHEASLSTGRTANAWRETIAVASKWESDPNCAPGIRRCARRDLRRASFTLTTWEARDKPLVARIRAAQVAYANAAALGTGSFVDLRWNLVVHARDLVAAAVTRSST